MDNKSNDIEFPAVFDGAGLTPYFRQWAWKTYRLGDEESARKVLWHIFSYMGEANGISPKDSRIQLEDMARGHFAVLDAVAAIRAATLHPQVKSKLPSAFYSDISAKLVYG